MFGRLAAARSVHAAADGDRDPASGRAARMRSQISKSRHTAYAAIPSPRPVKPMPSFVLAFMLM
jgi:hypothetical protein